VPVDIDRNTLAMDPSAVNRFGGLSAVIAAHLFGIPAPLHLIRNRNLVEDCAQTLAVRVGGRKVGSFGRLSICSFYATKLVTTGHGGAVAGDDPELFRRISDLFDHDNREEWEPHLHYRMSDLNAALGVGQLGKLGRFISCRRRIARRYAGALGCKVLSAGCYSRFLVVSERLDAPELAGLFSSCGIEAKSPVFKPVFMYLGEPASRFPNADWAYRKLVSVPIYPGMEECQVRRIEEKLRRHRNEISCWPPA
jgi:dTDP-4-amino-4,6-dideoxygalactose transaminase